VPSREVANPSLFRIFLNYRREDSSGHAGRMYDALRYGVGDEPGFGEGQIFMDIDTIDVGVDFPDVIRDAVGSCDVFVSIIGKQWLTAVDAKGRRRLEKPEDFVRLEIEAALERDIRLIPALVQGAEMPSSEELPEALAALTRRNAIELSDTRWRFDVGRLVTRLKELEQKKAEELERETREHATAGERIKPRPPETAGLDAREQQRHVLSALAQAKGVKLSSINRQLELLPQHLAPDEELLGACQTEIGLMRRLAILAVTSRRLVWVQGSWSGSNVQELPYERIIVARGEREELFSRKLVISGLPDAVEFHNVTPQHQADALASLINERAHGER
jgi:hypothetical protein